MGMNHDMSHIAGAHPFDPVLVDMMIPHHQGAITMSEVLFRRGTGIRTRRLAEQIVSSQVREIQENAVLPRADHRFGFARAW